MIKAKKNKKNRCKPCKKTCLSLPSGDAPLCGNNQISSQICYKFDIERFDEKSEVPEDYKPIDGCADSDHRYLFQQNLDMKVISTWISEGVPGNLTITLDYEQQDEYKAPVQGAASVYLGNYDLFLSISTGGFQFEKSVDSFEDELDYYFDYEGTSSHTFLAETKKAGINFSVQHDFDTAYPIKCSNTSVGLKKKFTKNFATTLKYRTSQVDKRKDNFDIILVSNNSGSGINGIDGYAYVAINITEQSNSNVRTGLSISLSDNFDLKFNWNKRSNDMALTLVANGFMDGLTHELKYTKHGGIINDYINYFTFSTEMCGCHYV